MGGAVTHEGEHEPLNHGVGGQGVRGLVLQGPVHEDPGLVREGSGGHDGVGQGNGEIRLVGPLGHELGHEGARGQEDDGAGNEGQARSSPSDAQIDEHATDLRASVVPTLGVDPLEAPRARRWPFVQGAQHGDRAPVDGLPHERGHGLRDSGRQDVPREVAQGTVPDVWVTAGWPVGGGSSRAREGVLQVEQQQGVHRGTGKQVGAKQSVMLRGHPFGGLVGQGPTGRHETVGDAAGWGDPRSTYCAPNRRTCASSGHGPRPRRLARATQRQHSACHALRTGAVPPSQPRGTSRQTLGVVDGLHGDDEIQGGEGRSAWLLLHDAQGHGRPDPFLG